MMLTVTVDWNRWLTGSPEASRPKPRIQPLYVRSVMAVVVSTLKVASTELPLPTLTLTNDVAALPLILQTRVSGMPVRGSMFVGHCSQVSLTLFAPPFQDVLPELSRTLTGKSACTPGNPTATIPSVLDRLKSFCWPATVIVTSESCWRELYGAVALPRSHAR